MRGAVSESTPQGDWPLCRHGDGYPAVARFRCERGCVVFPSDREQDLCAQHVVGWGFIDDSAEVIAIYHMETAKRLRIA